MESKLFIMKKVEVIEWAIWAATPEEAQQHIEDKDTKKFIYEQILYDYKMRPDGFAFDRVATAEDVFGFSENDYYEELKEEGDTTWVPEGWEEAKQSCFT